MPIDIREPAAIRGAAVLVFHRLVSAAVGAKIPIIHVQDPVDLPACRSSVLILKFV
jgi:hypothetical protein